jgi:hypothetical protein
MNVCSIFVIRKQVYLEILLQASFSITTLSLLCFASTDSCWQPVPPPLPDCVMFLVVLDQRVSLILPQISFSCYCMNVGEKLCRAENILD